MINLYDNMSYKTSSIILNVSNVVQNGYNSFLEASFPGSSVNLKNAEVALGSLSLYNSSFNINSTLYANNTISLRSHSQVVTRQSTLAYLTAITHIATSTTIFNYN